MKNQRTHRPDPNGQAISRTVLSVVRILIASYFLASATGLIFEPAARTFFDGVLLESHAQMATTIYLFVTAFAIMVGKAVRPAALLLAVYIFWSGFLSYNMGMNTQALSTFWRDMALLGAVLLIAVTEPGGSSKFRLWSKPVAPRRVACNRATGTTRSARPDRPAAAAGIAAYAAQPVNEFIDLNAADNDPCDKETDVFNIFADVFEPRVMAA